jgi:CheY-like chemotaxis protein
VGKNFDYRIYSQYLNQAHMPSLTGQDGGDAWHMLRGGFRADGTLSSKDSLTIQGDMYTGNENNPTTTLPSITSPSLIDTDIPVALSGGFIQSIWNHTFSARSETTLMMSYADYERDDQLREGRQTVNIDFQHHISWGNRQDFVWGLGYWYSDSHSDGDLFVSLNPRSLVSDSFNFFVQDEITLIPNRFFLTVGTKLEHSYYTGFALVEQIRQKPELATATIMMLTSAGHRGDAARCQELGVSAYLLKPIRQSELREAVARVLGAREHDGAIPLITRFSLQDAHEPDAYLSVLLAEDNLVNQRLVVRLLEKRGHRVVVAGTGLEALQALEKESFDLVLVDVQMPEMDGLEATTAIREKEKSSGLHQPVVALTAHAMKGDREKCMAGGMDGYLCKPIRPQELDQLLEIYVTRRLEARSVTEPAMHRV